MERHDRTGRHDVGYPGDAGRCRKSRDLDQVFIWLSHHLSPRPANLQDPLSLTLGNQIPVNERRLLTPFGIAAIYALVGSAWIFLSDRLLLGLGSTTVSSLTRNQTLKGLLYVGITATLVYFLVRAGTRALRASQAMLKESDSRYRQIFERTGAVVLIEDAETGRIVEANPAAARFYGWPADQLVGKQVRDLEALEDPAPRQEGKKGAGPMLRYSRCRTSDGSVREVVIDALGISINGRPHNYLVVHDDTGRWVLERKLRQAQRMEAVGRLTGGMARDLNNIFGIIETHADLLTGGLPPGDSQARNDLAQVRAAGRRGADLIRKLLGFSRGTLLTPVTSGLGASVVPAIERLRALLTPGIELSYEDRSQGTVRVDPQAMGQVLLGLATNARDAMPHGGRLGVSIRDERIDDVRNDLIEPGDYVVLEVTDTGAGMDEQVRAHVFEPFFTTRPYGEGAGLGLSMVYGLVKQHLGYVQVSSAPGRGTTVTIHLPRFDEVIEAGPSLPPEAVRGRKTTTILLVEDEAPLRNVGRRILEREGYRVLVAGDGVEAMEVYRQHRDELDLVISDLAMPRQSGRQLFETLQQDARPIRLLLTSGYAPPEPGAASLERPDTPFLPKPWTMEELSRKVKEVLDG